MTPLRSAALAAVTLLAFAAGLSAADYKVPHYVRFFGDFPRTSTGKFYKLKLREMFA